MRRVFLLLLFLSALSSAPNALAGGVREVRGEIVSLDRAEIAVRGTTVVRCGFGLDSPRPTGVKAGDTIAMTCVGASDYDAGEPPLLVAAISGNHGKPRPGSYTRRDDRTVFVEGVVTGMGRGNGPRSRSVTSITIRPLNWDPPVTCGVDPKTRFFGLVSEGTLVRLMCVDDEVRATDRKWSVDRMGTIISGRVASVSATSISIRPLMGGADPVVCSVNANSPSLEPLRPGVRVAIQCGMTKVQAFERVVLLETGSRLWVTGRAISHQAGVLNLLSPFGDRIACTTAGYDPLPLYGLSWKNDVANFDRFDCRRRGGRLELTAAEDSNASARLGTLVAASATSITIQTPFGQLTYALRPSTRVLPKLVKPPGRPYAPTRDSDNARSIADGVSVLDHYELGETVCVSFTVVGPHRDDLHVLAIS